MCEIWETFNWGKVKMKRNFKCEDSIPNPNIYKGRTKLFDRLGAETCEKCGKSNQKLQIHHKKTVRNKN